MALIADKLGQPLMPWQRYVADVGLEILPNGYPAYREVVISVPRQNGKGLDEDTPIPTPTGWTTIGELSVGDLIFDEQGQICRVSFISDRRLLDCYRVTFSDGSSLVADADHLWTVFDVWSTAGWQTLSTAEMVGKESVGTRGKNESRYRLPATAPLDCPDSDLPIDPYVLGAWLGDGDSAAARLTVGSSDLDELIAQVENAGYLAKTRRQDKRTGAWTFRLDANGGENVQTLLRTHGLLNDKHIPAAYLRASVTQRLALLQGLMDTDGTVTVNGTNRTSRSCEFCVCNERLALGALELLRSLGIRCAWKSAPAKLNGREVGTRYRLQFVTDLPTFRLRRKAARHAERGPLRPRSRTIRSIEPIPTVPTRCIQVDSPSSLFLAGDGFIPTHNTTLILAWEIDRALSWGRRQRIIYSAQTGRDAREKLLEDQVPIIEGSPFSAAIQKVDRQNGGEAIVFKGGSRISVVASSESAGHGKTIGLGVVDEGFDDVDNRREQALLPAMRTVRDAQLIVASTMGTDASIYLNRKVDTGRMVATEDRDDSRLAYFEWSAPDDADIGDPRVWAACTPALGYTIDLDTIHAEYESNLATPGEFKRFSLNQRTASDERVIPLAEWEAVCSPDAKPEGRVVFAIDCDPERTRSSIASADSDGNVELVNSEPGTGWLTARAIELARKWNGAIVIDPGGPAGSFLPDLKAAGVRIVEVGGGNLTKACGMFYDAVIEGHVRVRRNGSLDAACAAAQKRPSGDAWVWTRKSSSIDISPVVAATCAYWAAQQATGPSEYISLSEVS